MKNELETKIEKLKKEDALKKEVAKKIKGVDFYTFLRTDYIKGDKKRILFMFKDVKDVKAGIQQILKAFPVNRKKNQILAFAGRDDLKTANPFKLYFKNPCMYERKAEICYNSGKFDIAIEFPENFYHFDVIEANQRNISDCEYHYFIGRSHIELRKIRVRQIRLKGFPYVNYYGGSVVNYIADKAQQEKFEKIVLTGNI